MRQGLSSRALLALLLIGASAAGGCSRSPEDAARQNFYASLNPSRDFTLTDQDGRPWRLSEHRGQVVLLFFGYLSCPDVCPTTLAKLSTVYSRLGPGLRPKVLTVFVSIDAARDTPERMKEYLSYFKLNAAGLTGSRAAVAKVARAYRVVYVKHKVDSAMGYLYDHTDAVFLLDGEGRVRDELGPDQNADLIAAKVRRLL